MGSSKRFELAIASVAIALTAAATSHAQFTYNFDSLTGSPTPGTPLVGTPTVGAVGQDNWVLTSGPTATPYVRNDPLGGFSGNYLRGTIADATTTTQDTIVSRWNGSSLGLTGQYATLSADLLVGVGGQGATAPIYRRSEVALGVDSTGDGKIRPTAASNENAEWGITFGYEAASGQGSGWYVRPPSLGTAVLAAAPTVSGVWRTQLVIDLTANSNNGSGSLYIKQIADEAGNLVDDVFRLADPSLANINLGIQRQAVSSAGGSSYAANPANWDGIIARIAGNGGIDNISVASGLPNSTPVWAANAGSWLSAGNWYLSVPNAVDAVAEFSAGTKVDATVYADAAVTAGTIRLRSSHTYNLSGTGSLTLQTSTGSALVDVQTGSHKINLPLNIASNTTLNVAAGTTLRISDPVTVQSGKAITQTGAGTVLYESTINVLGSGSIAFANSLHAASLNLASSATASVASPAPGGVSVVQIDSLTLASGASFDLGTNELLTTMTQAQALDQIKTGRLRSSAATGQRNLGYGDIGGGKVRVIYTLLGDTNIDRTVNFSDLLTVAQNYGATDGKYFAQGDFNYDSAVNFADLLALAQNYGGSIGAVALPDGVSASFASDWALAQSLVPEPTTLGLLGASMLIARRRRA